jgi:hypothetical protein
MAEEQEIIEPQLPPNAEDAMRSLLEVAPEVQPEVKKEDKPGESPPPVDEKPPVKPDDVVPPKADEKPIVEPPIEPVVEDKFDSEIDAEELPPNASEKSKKGFATVKSRAKAEHKARVEAEQRTAKIEAERQAEAERIKDLESKLPTPEQIQRQKELEQFHQTFGLENDPALSAPFDQRVVSANQSLEGVMKQLGVPDGTIKFINENGGLYSFRMSNTRMPQNVKNKDGTPMTQGQFYKLYIEPNLSDAQKEEVSDAYTEIRKAHRDKQQAVDHLKSNRGEFLKKREESVKAAQQDWVDRVGKHSEVVKKSYGEAAVLKDIPPDATPEQKKAIEAHNASYRKAEARALKIISEVTPENLVEAAIAAGYVDIMKDKVLDVSNELEKVKADRDSYKTKYEDLKNAGKTYKARVEGAPANVNIKHFKTAGDAMTALVEANME